MFQTIYKVTSPCVIEEFIDSIDLTKDQTLVKVDYMAICKADIRYFLGTRDQNVLNHKYPLAPIHEAVGHVLKDPTGTFKPGDKVILIPNSVEEKYLKDFENERCKREDLGNNYAIHSTFRSSTTDGFLKQFYTAKPELLVKFDKEIPSNLAVFSELLSVAVAALRRINFSETKHVAIFGDGILAYITYIVMRHDHKDTKLTIYGIDKNKLAMFEEAEAKTYDQYNGEKYDTMIEIVGGKYSADAINKMIDWATVGADLILMGVSEDKVPLNTRLVLEKGLSLKGVTRSDRGDFEHVAQLLKDKHVQEQIKPMVLSENEIKTVNDIYRCYEQDINNKTLIGKNIMKW